MHLSGDPESFLERGAVALRQQQLLVAAPTFAARTSGAV
jgi:hypothetical protein